MQLKTFATQNFCSSKLLQPKTFATPTCDDDGAGADADADDDGVPRTTSQSWCLLELRSKATFGFWSKAISEFGAKRFQILKRSDFPDTSGFRIEVASNSIPGRSENWLEALAGS